MRAKIVSVLGAIVLAASALWALLDREGDSLPEGAVASDSVTITVGGGASGLLTAAQWGMVAGGLLLLAGLIWMAVERRAKRKQAQAHLVPG